MLPHLAEVYTLIYILILEKYCSILAYKSGESVHENASHSLYLVLAIK